MTASPRPVSLWFDQIAAQLPTRPALPGDRDTDVAIVGAGFTGLWTAYYLRRLDPTRRITVLERRFAGFGASGRNGGWCSAFYPVSWDRLAAEHGRAPALAMRRALIETVAEIQRVSEAEHIDCGFAKGGTLALARSAVHWRRAQQAVADDRAWGDGPEQARLLGAAEVRQIAGVAGVLGASFSAHCAALQPARLVTGLAAAVAGLGVDIFENTAVTEISAGRVRTERGTVRAEVVIRATEAYTSQLAGYRRRLAPVYSLIVATEPVDHATLDAVGLAGRPTFTDHRHMICYGQRTADGRIVFGGRGAPYHFGSATLDRFDRDPRVFELLREGLRELFPALAGVRFSHAWGGPLGIPRDWHPGVGLDRATGLGWAGGYVGDGVAAANLAGRTLAALIAGADSDLVTLPWVGHRSRTWEPEPVRFLGINAGLRLMGRADGWEQRTGIDSSAARLFGRWLGE